MVSYCKNLRLIQFWLAAVLLLLCGCENTNVVASSNKPDKPAENVVQPLPPSKTVNTEPAGKAVITEQVVKPVQISSQNPLEEEKIYQKILTGDFDKAQSQVDQLKISPDTRLAQLRDIISEYGHIKRSRKKSLTAAYEEEYKEFEKIAAEPIPSDVNDLDEAFAAVIKTHKRANKEQKKALLENPYVKQLVEKVLENGKAFEAENKWTDAYFHSYFWLANLYKDNKEYKGKNELLMDKLIIEASLTDNSCETGMERHEGIKPEMLVRVLQILDRSYVSVIDYSEMAEKGIERCKLLGDVLLDTSEDFEFKITAENHELWSAGMQMVADEIEGDDLKVVTKDKFIWLFQKILAINEVTIGIPQEIVIAQFCEAALIGLDPVTNLVWPWRVKDFQKNMTQNFTGIGIHIIKLRGSLEVASLLPDTPAYRSGLDADDKILAVNGESTKDMPILCVVSKITGPAGTDVTLTVRHKDAPEDETEDITITRARIVVPTIRGWQRTETGQWRHMIDPVNRLGYIRIKNFTESTVPAMQKALKKLEKDGMKGLILDLRYNSGGYLNTAADIVDMFIEKGLIVKSQPKWQMPTYEMAHKNGTHPNYPLVLLVNGSSASASEIVAGALSDEKYERATIVGSRSYGKGSVQTITDQSGYGSQLKYTMAYYYLPSGQPVKTRYILKKEDRTDWGIEPDVKIKHRDDEIVRMLEIQFSNDVLVKADHNDNAKPVKRYTIGETLDSDPQLSTGLLVLKTKVLKTGGGIEQIANARPEDIEQANAKLSTEKEPSVSN
jgi:carboxyl-terminal processing protease